MKHLARVTLLVVILLAAYIALHPQYNLAHWTPNRTMRRLGFSYESVLAYEHHLHWFLHWFIGMIVTLLLYLSNLYYPSNGRNRIITGFLLVGGMALVTEFLQSTLGGSVEIADLIFGFIGIVMATALLVPLIGGKNRSNSK